MKGRNLVGCSDQLGNWGGPNKARRPCHKKPHENLLNPLPMDGYLRDDNLMSVADMMKTRYTKSNVKDCHED